MATTEMYGEISDYFRGSAERMRLMGSPFYARLAAGVVEAPDLLALASLATTGQPPCHMLFGAVQSLLLEHPDEPLAAYYPSIAANPLPPDDIVPVFRAFCAAHKDAITAIIKSRKVQFTTVGRAALVLPAMVEVAREAGEPLSFIEVGLSVGLLTLFDRYRYDYGAAGTCGDPSAPLVSGCTFRDMPPLPKMMPKIGRRIGIDLTPIDPANAVERRWLDALLPPDWTEERKQLRTTLDFRAKTPFDVHTGDALAIVPQLLAEVPDPVCVFHAHCLYQWPYALREEFDTMLRAASRGRTIHRLSMEYADPRYSPIPEPSAYANDPVLCYETIHMVYRDGERTAKRLAVYDGYGKVAVWVG